MTGKNPNEEGILDALEWVAAIIKHYQERYEPERALNGVLGEIQDCLAIGKFPDNDGTRFREAITQLNQSQWPRYHR